MQVMHLMFYYRCGYLQSTYNTLKIRLNVVFCSKRDKMVLLDNTTYLTAKSKQPKTLTEIQDLSKQPSKLQFHFNVHEAEDKEIEAIVAQNKLLFL